MATRLSDDGKRLLPQESMAERGTVMEVKPYIVDRVHVVSFGDGRPVVTLTCLPAFDGEPTTVLLGTRDEVNVLIDCLSAARDAAFPKGLPGGAAVGDDEPSEELLHLAAAHNRDDLSARLFVHTLVLAAETHPELVRDAFLRAVGLEGVIDLCGWAGAAVVEQLTQLQEVRQAIQDARADLDRLRGEIDGLRYGLETSRPSANGSHRRPGDRPRPEGK